MYCLLICRETGRVFAQGEAIVDVGDIAIVAGVDFDSTEWEANKLFLIDPSHYDHVAWFDNLDELNLALRQIKGSVSPDSVTQRAAKGKPLESFPSLPRKKLDSMCFLDLQEDPSFLEAVPFLSLNIKDLQLHLMESIDKAEYLIMALMDAGNAHEHENLRTTRYPNFVGESFAMYHPKFTNSLRCLLVAYDEETDQYMCVKKGEPGTEYTPENTQALPISGRCARIACMEDGVGGSQIFVENYSRILPPLIYCYSSTVA